MRLSLRRRPRLAAEDDAAPRTSSQVLWALVSQGLTSVTTLILTIAVARALDEGPAGAFAYAFVVFTLAIGLSRATSSDPLVIRFSAADPAQQRRGIAQAAAASLGVGVAGGVLCALAGLVLGGEVGLALVLLLVVLPGQLLQDCWRNAAFATRDARAAAVNDGVRFVVQLAAIAACVIVGTDDLAWYLLGWAASSWAGAAAAMLYFGPPTGPRGALSWYRENAGLSVRLGSDYVLNMGSITLTMSVLAATLGLVATGGIRFAQTLLGPLRVLHGALVSLIVPSMARAMDRGGPGAVRRPAMLGGVLAVGSAAAVVGVMLVIPDAVGRELLGASWSSARAVLPAVGAAQIIIAIAMSGSLPLKAMGRADRLLQVSTVQGPLMLLLGVGGGWVAGIQGAAWGLTLAQAVGCAVIVVLAQRAMAGKGPTEPLVARLKSASDAVSSGEPTDLDPAGPPDRAVPGAAPHVRSDDAVR